MTGDRAELLRAYNVLLNELQVEARERGLALQRAERVEATLAAIRALDARWRDGQFREDHGNVMDSKDCADELRAVLDADVPRGTPPANICADG